MISNEIKSKLKSLGLGVSQFGFGSCQVYDIVTDSCFHNPYGPSVIHCNVDDKCITSYFHLNGIRYTDTKEFFQASGMSSEDVLIAVLKFGETLPLVHTGASIDDLFYFPPSN